MMQIPVVIMNPSKRGDLKMRKKKSSVMNIIGISIGIGGLFAAGKYAADGYELTNIQTAGGTLAVGLLGGIAAMKMRPTVGAAALGAGVALGGNSLAKALVYRKAKAALSKDKETVEGLGSYVSRRMQYSRPAMGAIESAAPLGAVGDGFGAYAGANMGALVFED